MDLSHFTTSRERESITPVSSRVTFRPKQEYFLYLFRKSTSWQNSTQTLSMTHSEKWIQVTGILGFKGTCQRTSGGSRNILEDNRQTGGSVWQIPQLISPPWSLCISLETSLVVRTFPSVWIEVWNLLDSLVRSSYISFHTWNCSSTHYIFDECHLLHDEVLDYTSDAIFRKLHLEDAYGTDYGAAASFIIIISLSLWSSSDLCVIRYWLLLRHSVSLRWCISLIVLDYFFSFSHYFPVVLLKSLCFFIFD